MSKFKSYSKQDNNLELEPDMTLLTDETLSTDIRLVGGVFDLKLSVTSEQFNRLLTAALEGAYAAYPDDYNNVLAPLILAGKRLADAMSCVDVADCIDSEILAGNTTLINALLQNAINTGSGGNYNRVNGDITTVLDRNPPLSLQESINPEFECDLDKLWGAIRHGIVERLDDTARDLLEDLAAINDLPQRFQTFIDIVPIAGDIAEALVTLATEVIPDILNLYNAHSSEAVLDEIACYFFSLVCADCRMPTFEEIYNHYSTLGYEMSAMNVQTLAPLMQKLSSMIGTFQPSSVVYHSMITFQLFTLYLQAQWNGNAGTSTLYKWGRLGEDFGSDNWFDLCSTCNELYARYEWDFRTQGQGESYIDTATGLGTASGLGTFVNGKGWQSSANSSGGAFSMKIAYALDPSWTIRAIAWQTSENPASRAATFRPNIATTTGSTAIGFSGACPPYNNVQDGLLSIGNFKEVGIRFNSNNAIYLEKIVIIFDNGSAKAGSVPSTDSTIC